MGTRHIVYMGLTELRSATRNPKKHDLPSLVGSLRRYGWTNPAVLDERTGLLVAGHGRLEAAFMCRQAGDPPPGGVHVDDDGEWLVPVLRGWESRNDTEAEAYIIADNQLTIAGGWDLAALGPMLEDVVTEDAPLMETLGWTADDLDDLLRRYDPEKRDQDADGDPWADTDKSAGGGVPDPDPHSPLPGDDEASVTDPDPADPDLALAGKSRTITCPNCNHTWEK